MLVKILHKVLSATQNTTGAIAVWRGPCGKYPKKAISKSGVWISISISIRHQHQYPALPLPRRIRSDFGFLDFAFRISDFGFLAYPKPSWHDIPNMTNKLILGPRPLLNISVSVKVKSWTHYITPNIVGVAQKFVEWIRWCVSKSLKTD